MKILVLNAGSSSIKFKLFDNEDCLISGLVEEIGNENSKVKWDFEGQKQEEKIILHNHKEALNEVIKILKQYFDLNEISCITHRVVHGGEEFKDTVLITDEILKKLDSLNYLAPLHNPPAILGIKLMRELLPGKKNVAVFDTSFHSSIPEKAYLYGLPFEYYEKYKIRKYGFHGTSHKYVAKEAIDKLKKKNAKIITCHLGNGASITATLNGKSVDTSMGFTPLEGLVMGTRSGSLDPTIISFLAEKEKLTHKEVESILNKKSGMLGISKLSSDMRVLNDEYDKNKLAKIALDMYAYNVLRFIGSYAAVLNGIDAIVFTAGIGENDWKIREMVLENLGYLGIHIDKEKNKNKEMVITTKDSSVPVFIIRTNEELQMIRETMILLDQKKNIKKK